MNAVFIWLTSLFADIILRRHHLIVPELDDPLSRYQLKLRLTASFIVTVGLFSALVIYLLLWLIA
ncbi:hypothetical protein [Loigolactobacillus jiayinensis]|uniref:Uncharacterized protein n=1 Tax=Loigolactobacillus jiayinensis TaxID=2486016 RepID=A0ABW1RCM3_9LACO|nr:hypothetical protein [Loigolactobacillus jiayinensis]